VIVSSFFPAPFDVPKGYAPLEDYKTKYRGT